MITEIRNYIKTSSTSSMIGLITVLALGGVFSLPMLLKQVSSSGPWAFKVSGKEISYQEFSRESADQQERINRFKAQYGQFAEMLFQSQGIDLNPQVFARDILIRQELLDQLAESIHIEITQDFIVQKLQDRDFIINNLSDIIQPFVFDQNGSLSQESYRLYTKQQ